MASPKDAEGVDYVWAVAEDGARVPTVLFCQRCQGSDVAIGVQRYGGVSLAEPYGFQRVGCPVG